MARIFRPHHKPEVIAQVSALRKQGLGNRRIAKTIEISRIDGMRDIAETRIRRLRISRLRRVVAGRFLPRSSSASSSYAR